MASDNKRTKADPAAKKEAAAKNKSTPGEDVAKAAGSETAAAAPSAPANYSRGEGQKPVTTAYKENWKAIFAKKNAKKNTKKNTKKKKR
jgi:hypothetical protein